MYPHRIRLRGPWEHESLPAAAGTRHRRRFGYPGQIDTTERVWITCAGVTGKAVVTLNKQPLGSPPSGVRFEYEVTPLLSARNELLIDIAGEQEADLWGEVAMEIRRTAYLRGCRVGFVKQHWHASGELCGEAEGELELYLIVERRTVAYRTIRTSSGPVVFTMQSDEPGELNTQARLELIQGAVVWFGLDLALGES